MPRRPEDRDRAVVLARRARFIATALASVGVGLHPTLGFARTESEAGPPAGDAAADPEEKGPRICLSDIDVEGEAIPGCDDDGQAPGCYAEPCLSAPPDLPPQVCLSDVPPQVCLSIAPPSDNLPHHHDGFYLRAGALGGVLSLSADADRSARTNTGIAFGGQLALGMTVAPGVVVGIGGSVLHAPTSNTSAQSSLAIWQVGPWLDVFASDRGGWHGTLSLAPTVLRARDAQGVISGVGFGGSLWLGYDAWIGPDWSIGLAGGGMLGFASGKREDQSVALRARALALAATLLWH
jgi:hypothetical protein